MNKSALTLLLKLRLNHRIIAEGGIPPLKYENEKEKLVLAERFGEYGVKSGVDIRKLWPTIEEIEEKNALKMYRKAAEMKKVAEDKIEAEEIRRKNRLEKIETSWKKHDKMLTDYYEEKAKSGDEQKIQEEELQKKIREVQEYFGYWVDPKDPRFELMLQEKDENAKLAAKLEKQKEKKKKQQVINPDIK